MLYNFCVDRKPITIECTAEFELGLGEIKYACLLMILPLEITA